MSDPLQKRGVDAVLLCAMGALAMSYGWGYRGDYGHEFGAMIPGALMALGVCLLSGREAFWSRWAPMGAAGAIGWALGGQMSYGNITSYTVSDSFPDVYYGYACLFMVGGLWGGLGGGLLSQVLTRPRRELAQFVPPVFAMGAIFFLAWLVMHIRPDWRYEYEVLSIKYLRDSDWLSATLALGAAGLCALVFPKSRSACTLMAMMCVGWWLGYLILVHCFGLHTAPTQAALPGELEKVRSDSWAGCMGAFLGLLSYLALHRNRAGIMLALYGAMAGGLGFSIGDFINKPDKVRWQPFYQYDWAQGFDHWKWSEQSFGLIMGLGVSLGILRLLRGHLAVNEEGSEEDARRITGFSLLVLLGAMPWMNLRKNVSKWTKKDAGIFPEDTLFGLNASQWFLVFAVLLSVFALAMYWRHRKAPLAIVPKLALGQGQLVFLLIMWVSAAAVTSKTGGNLHSRGMLFVHGSFWFSCLFCTFFLFSGRPKIAWSTADAVGAEDQRWRLGWRHALLWVLCPVILCLMTVVTMRMHEAVPGDGHRLRFGPDAWHLQPPE